MEAHADPRSEDPRSLLDGEDVDVGGACGQTTTRLLEGLKDSGNQTSWRALDQRMRPILLRFFRGCRMEESEAVDLAQITLADVFHAYRDGQYVRAKGRLSGWILGFARNRLRKHRAERANQREVPLESQHLDSDEECALEERWRADCRREIMARAIDLLRQQGGVSETTFTAFARTCLEGASTGAVAESWG